jgi:hypothetical protein
VHGVQDIWVLTASGTNTRKWQKCIVPDVYRGPAATPATYQRHDLEVYSGSLAFRSRELRSQGFAAVLHSANQHGISEDLQCKTVAGIRWNDRLPPTLGLIKTWIGSILVKSSPPQGCYRIRGWQRWALYVREISFVT